MLAFQQGEFSFNYRVIGVAIHKGRLLLHKSKRGDFWSLPGGRGEFMEDSEFTLRREMEEEIGTQIKIDRLLCLSENFFKIEGRSFHEIGIYYAIRFPKDSPIWKMGDEFKGIEKDRNIQFRWFTKKDLKKTQFKPEFIMKLMKDPPKGVFHFVTRD